MIKVLFLNSIRIRLDFYNIFEDIYGFVLIIKLVLKIKF